jgi:hypothetical protein
MQRAGSQWEGIGSNSTIHVTYFELVYTKQSAFTAHTSLTSMLFPLSKYIYKFLPEYSCVHLTYVV